MTIAIYGAGGFGRELIPVASRDGREICFVSDRAEEIGQMVLGVTVYSPEQAVVKFGARLSFVIAVADTAARKRIAARLSDARLAIASATAPTAVVGPGVEIGEGAILFHHTAVTASATIGRHFHCNSFSYVSHDCTIGDFVTFAPRVGINGNTVIEDEVFIGSGAVLKHGTPDKPLRIGKGAIIGMGAVVTKDVAPGAVMVGNPARAMERK